jgi:hypothetical protein
VKVLDSQATCRADPGAAIEEELEDRRGGHEDSREAALEAAPRE